MKETEAKCRWCESNNVRPQIVLDEDRKTTKFWFCRDCGKLTKDKK